MTAQVDVVVLTWNDAPLATIAVESALASEGVDVSVVVVDNGSDPPFEYADPRVHVIRNEENRGVAPARNQGVRAGDRTYVCLLDSDARLHERGLRSMLEPLETEEGVGLSAPTFTGQSPEASAGRAPTLSRKLRRAFDVAAVYDAVPHPDGAKWWDVDFAIGACQFFRREAFDAVDGLDDTIFYGPEDVDFCLRLREKGWRIVQLADAVCDHPPRRSNRKLLSRRGLEHAVAIGRHLWRHRRSARGS